MYKHTYIHTYKHTYQKAYVLTQGGEGVKCLRSMVLVFIRIWMDEYRYKYGCLYRYV
jgi:hypothetical protein